MFVVISTRFSQRVFHVSSIAALSVCNAAIKREQSNLFELPSVSSFACLQHAKLQNFFVKSKISPNYFPIIFKC